MSAPSPRCAPDLAGQSSAAVDHDCRVAFVRRVRRGFLSLLVAVLTVLWVGNSTAVAADMSKPQPPAPEPAEYRMDNYRAPVPATLKGAKVVTAVEARDIWLKGGAAFIDVYPHAPKPANLPKDTIWRDPTHFSIENAKWLANTGYGALSKATEAYFKKNLEQLSGGDLAKPLVFFCLRNCWMSWNAAKRAMAYGYSNVIWFPEGFDAWQEIGEPISEIKPAI